MVANITSKNSEHRIRESDTKGRKAWKVEFIKLSPDKSSWEQGDSGESILRSKR